MKQWFYVVAATLMAITGGLLVLVSNQAEATIAWRMLATGVLFICAATLITLEGTIGCRRLVYRVMAVR
ncbi:MAG: hypothetical protein WCT08_03555 [Patescibacteria group bacterium]|jgi:hypothetical protein